MTMKKTDKQLIFSKLFPDEESCIRYYEDKRWGGNPVSPFDPSSKVYKCRNGKYKCKNTGRYFDVKTGTKFANTKLPLRYWFYAMFLFLSHKRGVSSCQLALSKMLTDHEIGRFINRTRQGVSFIRSNRQKLRKWTVASNWKVISKYIASNYFICK